MEAQEPMSTQATPPKGKGTRKAKPKPTPVGNGKRSLNLSLPVEDYERLAIHAMRMDTTISDLVSRLAREHCREYHISRTGTRAADGTEAA
jgi:hypothetical protein